MQPALFNQNYLSEKADLARKVWSLDASHRALWGKRHELIIRVIGLQGTITRKSWRVQSINSNTVGSDRFCGCFQVGKLQVRGCRASLQESRKLLPSWWQTRPWTWWRSMIMRIFLFGSSSNRTFCVSLNEACIFGACCDASSRAWLYSSAWVTSEHNSAVVVVVHFISRGIYAPYW